MHSGHIRTVSGTFRLLIVSCLMLSLASAIFVETGFAQSGEDVARGLLKALIESQLEKSRRRNGGPSTNLRPGQPRNAGQPDRSTPEMQKLQPITASFAQEAATLAALLQTDSRRSVEARRYLPDAIRLQATATAISQRAASQNNHLSLMDDFRNLNSEWATLSHQLSQCRSLPNPTTACIQRLSALDTQYCSILGIQEQFNHEELARTAYSLTTYLRDLTEDIQTQPQSRTTGRQHVRELGQLNQKAEYFAGLVARRSGYAAVVSEYQTLYQDWSNAEKFVTGYTGHTVARSLRRIRDSHQTIHQLLRLETGIDKNLVLSLIHDVDHQLEDLFRTMTLEQLMTLPDASAVPDAADAVHGTVQNIDDLVHRDENIQSIAEAWVFTSEAWNQFSYYVSPIRESTVVLRLKSIGDSMHSLQQALGISVQYDPAALVANASSLEALAERLVLAIRAWQTHPGQHDPSLVTKAQQMVRHFHNIEQSLAARRGGTRHRGECDQAIALWQQIRPALKTCDTAEREQFDYIAATLTPDVVRLRTMLDE
ncbi:MAG: hypothetical protein R3C59_07900 [Planctomycetaceae bacterium]